MPNENIGPKSSVCLMRLSLPPPRIGGISPAMNAPQTEDKTLLIVEDDRPFRERLARAMEARGFSVGIAETVAQGVARAKDAPPAYAVVDLKLDDGNGLDVVETLHQTRPDARVVVL